MKLSKPNHLETIAATIIATALIGNSWNEGGAVYESMLMLGSAILGALLIHVINDEEGK